MLRTGSTAKIQEPEFFQRFDSDILKRLVSCAVACGCAWLGVGRRIGGGRCTGATGGGNMMRKRGEEAVLWCWVARQEQR
jgi:hypothetical protein